MKTGAKEIQQVNHVITAYRITNDINIGTTVCNSNVDVCKKIHNFKINISSLILICHSKQKRTENNGAKLAKYEQR